MNNKITTDRLRKLLLAEGWTISKGLTYDPYIDWYAYKKRLLGDVSADCAWNEMPPSVVIKPYFSLQNGKELSGVEISMTGETGGQWVKIEAYSIRLDEVMEKLSKVTTILLAAWNAAAAVEM